MMDKALEFLQPALYTILFEKFISLSTNSLFSGIAIYTESVSGMLVRINQYRNGQKVRGVFLPGPPSERKEKIRRAKLLVGKIRLGRTISVSTRSWGEDTWDKALLALLIIGYKDQFSSYEKFRSDNYQRLK